MSSGNGIGALQEADIGNGRKRTNGGTTDVEISDIENQVILNSIKIGITDLRLTAYTVNKTVSLFLFSR